MKVSRREIGIGDRSVDRTVEAAVALVHRGKTNKIVAGIAASLRAGTEWETARNIFRYVVQNVRYVSDPPGIEQIAAPWILFGGEKPYGDCDDMTIAVCALCYALGIPSYMKVIAWRKEDFTHIYPLIGLREFGIVVPADPVMGLYGWGNEKIPVIRSKVYKV